MHNHLRKLGFFTSNTATNSNEEEKRVKYLYKNEKHYKIKSKSSNEENTSGKRRQHHHHHHKHRRHHKTSSSQAELDLMLMLPEEEVKKHRKSGKHRKKHEEEETTYRKVHKKKKAEQFNTNTSLDKYFVIETAENDESSSRRVTKKRSSSAPVRIADSKDKNRQESKKSRHPKITETPENVKRDKKSSRRHHHNHETPETAPEKKHRKSRRKEVTDKTSYSQNFPSISSFEKKTRSRSVQGNSSIPGTRNTKSVSLNVPSTLSKINAYLLQHEKFLSKTGKNFSVTSSEPVTENFSTFDNSKHSFIDEEFISASNEHKSILKPKSCLVQTSFSIVNIPSVKLTRESIEISSIEKKKKSRSYKKYYDYNTESTSFSDCHKNYDSGSVILGDVTPRYKKNKLRVELIKPEIILEEKRVAVNHSKFSKIPVFSNKLKSRELHEEKKAEKIKKGRLNRNKSLPPIKEKSSSLQQSKIRRVQPNKSAENVRKTRNASPLLSFRKNITQEKPQLSARSRKSACSEAPPKKKIASAVSSNKSSFSSHSDPKITKEKVKKKQQQQQPVSKKKESSLRGSLSNSTFGDKSVDSGKTQTSFLLTKTYKDEDKWKRWQKRKEYADSVRKNLINRTQNKKNHPLNEQQIVEIRYLTVEKCNAGDDKKTKKKKPSSASPLTTPRKYETKKEETGFGHLVHRPEFEALIAPIEEDELINENLSFLKKDFTVTFAKVSYSSLDDEDWNGSDNNSCGKSNISDVDTDDVVTLKDVESPRRKSFNGVSSQETVLGDLPVSEESGYSTIKSSSFFHRPYIKALFELPPPLPVEFALCRHENCNNDEVVATVSKFCRDVSTASSLCTIDICAIESIGLQTENNATCERSTQDFFIEEEEEVLRSESEECVRKVKNLEAVQVIKIDITSSLNVENKQRRRPKLDKGYKFWLRKFKYAFRERKQKFSSFTCITTPNNE